LHNFALLCPADTRARSASRCVRWSWPPAGSSEASHSESICGVYIVVDHAAAAGSGLPDTETLHRIDPAVVKA
jgi:hypothetical protein